MLIVTFGLELQWELISLHAYVMRVSVRVCVSVSWCRGFDVTSWSERAAGHSQRSMVFMPSIPNSPTALNVCRGTQRRQKGRVGGVCVERRTRETVLGGGMSMEDGGGRCHGGRARPQAPGTPLVMAHVVISRQGWNISWGGSALVRLPPPPPPH